WGLEKQLHYLRDLSPAEDQSRIPTTPLPPMGALARNVAMNLYRDAVFTKMAQAQGKCGLGLEQV
ncbi:MAG: ISAs1 family transposase, partial [Cyanobacteria bacterium QH_3_48_40]